MLIKIPMFIQCSKPGISPAKPCAIISGELKKMFPPKPGRFGQQGILGLSIFALDCQLCLEFGVRG